MLLIVIVVGLGYCLFRLLLGRHPPQHAVSRNTAELGARSEWLLSELVRGVLNLEAIVVVLRIAVVVDLETVIVLDACLILHNGALANLNVLLADIDAGVINLN